MPVYNTPDAEDSLIRAYTRCPTYQRRLDAWFNSTDFLDKAAETKDFRCDALARALMWFVCALKMADNN